MILGLAIQPFELKWILFPLMVRAIGVFASILGTYSVRTIGKSQDAMAAIKLGFNTSAAISVVGFGLLSFLYVQDWRVFVATLSGILLAVAINYITDFATGTKHGAVQEIAESTRTGSATVILSGLASGMESSVWALFSIVAAIGVSVLVYWGQPYTLVLYGVALAGIGMLTLTGNNVAMDAFGPISDNASGIGEMAGLDEKARRIMADLDAVGNTTKAITKGIAIGSAVIAAVSLFGAFGDTVLRQLQAMGEQVSLEAGFAVNVADPMVFIGLLIGGAIPFLFSSMAIRAVSRAASLIVNEVRRQFRIPGLMEGKVKPDYTKAVNICTSAAQKELIGPALLAVLAPLVVGLLLKEAALGGFLVGIIVSGQLMAVFMSNAGGAWDNAKKYVEDGHYGGKGSDAHKAAVVGDTVGDPLKDTAGPALNPLIKVMNLVGLLIAPIVVAMRGYSWGIVLVAIICLGVIAWAVWNSKRKASWEVGQEEMQATIGAGGGE
jgi:K(+)-stimulated pyrophosphate-energized sodium pump